MSTRSRIAKRLADGRYRSVYCHFDGDSIGSILRNHYHSEEHAHMIVDHGDLSCITSEKLDAYRDRGEPWHLIKPINSEDLPSLISLAWETSAEYLYYWQDGAWQAIVLRGPRL